MMLDWFSPDNSHVFTLGRMLMCWEKSDLLLPDWSTICRLLECFCCVAWISPVCTVVSARSGCPPWWWWWRLSPGPGWSRWWCCLASCWSRLMLCARVSQCIPWSLPWAQSYFTGCSPQSALLTLTRKLVQTVPTKSSLLVWLNAFTSSSVVRECYSFYVVVTQLH